MTKILFVGAEAMPFAATGGLGDVLGSLPAALANKDGVDVRVVLPLYSAVSEKYRSIMKRETVFTVSLAWRQLYCGIFSLKKDRVTYYFVDNEYYFKRDGLYGHYDDGERYAFFCRAAMQLQEELDFYPDILHAHDWQAALSVVYQKTEFCHKEKYKNIKTVFTIHNIEYQGNYDHAILGDVFGIDSCYASILDCDGRINLMKAAIQCADKISTVSERYAKEICTYEYGKNLCSILNNNSYKLCGILNGIDYVYYDPEQDEALEAKYTADNAVAAKKINKKALQAKYGLPAREDVPLLSVISRLASHKGLDLLCEIAYNLVSERDIMLVILGIGEAKYEQCFEELERQFPNKVRMLKCYNRDLSRQIYAASDIFIMPSKSEPCGLSQMIASRYGAVPVVRETGGLYDSIKGYYEQDGELFGNGFTFANYSSAELYDRISAALDLYSDVDKYCSFVSKIMDVDFSWNRSADRYMEMYGSLLK